jgi:hypothetical protein
MIGAPNRFAREQKSAPTYLDVAAIDHGDEKGLLVHRALRRIESTEPHIVDIGPGGGAAVDYLATRTAEEPRPVRLTLVEVPGVSSTSLADATARFNAIGSCALVHRFTEVVAIAGEPTQHALYRCRGRIEVRAINSR